MQPTPLNERHEILDVLRGFALCGVIIANMAYHSGYWFLSPEKQAVLSFYELGESITWATHFITEGKFYSIFSLLFGVGFGLQIQRALQKNESFVGRFSRRLFILLLIGIVHAVLLYVGDILIVYALLGFVLILFRKANNKTLLRLVFLLPLLPVIQYAILWTNARGADTANEISGVEMFEQLLITYQTGSFPEILMTNTFGYVFGRFPDLIFTGRFFKVLAMFLLGFYIAKNRWFVQIYQNGDLLKRVMLWSAVIGIPCNFILANMMDTDTYYAMTASGIIEPIVYAYGVPALGMCYACGIALAYQKAWFRPVASALAPLGRMALTNYLMQSVICCLIFESYGLRLFGVVSPLFFTLIGISILIIQVICSNWWLSNYQYGPAEWIWRSMTYGRMQPMKTRKAVTIKS